MSFFDFRYSFFFFLNGEKKPGTKLRKMYGNGGLFIFKLVFSLYFPRSLLYVVEVIVLSIEKKKTKKNKKV